MDKVNLLSHNSLISPPLDIKPMREEAYSGLAGEIVKAIEPHSEADPIAILVQFLAAFGNLIGKRPHFIVEDGYHALKINPILIGLTSKGRKGTAWSRVTHLFNTAEPHWVKNNVTSGLSTGEGLIWNVRDSMGGDPGIPDKRLLIVEPEFSSVLKRADIPGNTLSQILRDSWDGDYLRTLTKQSPVVSRGAHINVIGHITIEELVRYLNKTEIAGGFGNRFIWVYVKRSKSLPFGGQIHTVDFESFINRLKQAITYASEIGEMKRDDAANQLWGSVYEGLAEGRLGIAGFLTARAEAYVMRIACIYALLDCSVLICAEHLKAALALWDYAERCVIHIFGDKLGNPIADTILTTLRTNSNGLSETEISALFSRHRRPDEIETALNLLYQHNKAEPKIIRTKGRPETRWFAAAK